MVSLEEFKQSLRRDIAEEAGAYDSYMGLSRQAEELGLGEESGILARIAQDEKNHNGTLIMMLSKIERAEGRAAAIGGLRLRTVADWQDLADAIIRVSPSTRSTVEEQMEEIRAGSTYAEGAKRVLLNLASSLGV